MTTETETDKAYQRQCNLINTNILEALKEMLYWADGDNFPRDVLEKAKKAVARVDGDKIEN